MAAVQFSYLAENRRILLCDSSNDTLEGYVARKVARTRTGTLGRMVMSRANARIRRECTRRRGLRVRSPPREGRAHDAEREEASG